MQRDILLYAMVAISRMYLSQSMKGVLHIHRRQRMQTCHLTNMIFGTILKEMSNPKKLNVTVLFA